MRRMRLAGAVLLLAVTGPAIVAGQATATNTTYYVDCGSTVSNPSGTSTADPWNTLALVNAHTFGPGDDLLFKAGSTCVGTLEPKGSGSAGSPVTATSYGTGAKPIINGNGAAWGVRLLDQSYWTISGLHVKSPAATGDERNGIAVVSSNSSTKSGIVISGNEVSDVAGMSDKTGVNSSKFANSAGIGVRANGTAGVFAGVEIVDNDVHDTGGGGIKIQQDPDNRRMHTGVHIADNTIRDVGGDGIVTHAVDAVVVERNLALDLGYGKYPYIGGEFAGMWPINARDPLFQYNTVGRTRATGFDATAWDCDGGIIGTCTYQYNYSYGNSGGFFLNCADCTSWGNSTTTMILRYNIAQDDCRFGAGAGNDTSPTYIYNNTFFCPSRPVAAGAWPNAQWRNNIFVAPSGTFPTGGSIVYDSNTYLGGVTPPAADANAVTADPKLASPGAGTELDTALNGYKLLTGSPALGSGAVISGNGGKDYYGNPVSATAAPNRGAYNGSGVAASVLPISKVYNQVAVTSDSNPNTGGLSTTYRSYSGQGLQTGGLTRNAVKTAGGVNFTWHSGEFGTPDNVKVAGQKIAVTGSGTTLGFLGFAVSGATTGSGVITFADGTTQNYTITLEDWWSTSSPSGNTAVATSAYHNQHDAPYNDKTTPPVATATKVWFTSVSLPAGKSVVSVTLPAGTPVVGPGMHLFDVKVGGGPTRIDRSQLSVTYVDSEDAATSGQGAKVIDGDTNTNWHTAWSQVDPDAALPHEIQISLGGSNTVSCLYYLPRQSGTNGRIKNYEVYTSTNGTTWGGPAVTGTWVDTAAEESACFTPRTATHVRLRALSEVNNGPWTSAAEIAIAG